MDNSTYNFMFGTRSIIYWVYPWTQLVRPFLLPFPLFFTTEKWRRNLGIFWVTFLDDTFFEERDDLQEDAKKVLYFLCSSQKL